MVSCISKTFITSVLAMLMACYAQAGVSITNIRANPITPWGVVSVEYDISGELPADAAEYQLNAVLTNLETHVSYRCVMGSGSGDLSLGHHSVFCDMTKNVSSIKWSTQYAVLLSYEKPLYCVIDLSKGASAGAYPVSYLFGVPDGGWGDEYKTTKLVLRRIESGSIGMSGSVIAELTRPFYLGVFEVTESQWNLVMGDGKDYRSTYPVATCSYDMIRGSTNGAKWPNSVSVDGTSFMGRVQVRTGLAIDLPTEVQWEYACRAKTKTKYYWGDTLDARYAVYNQSSPAKVGTLRPNDWGLYDMSGNMWEWCLDWYGTLSGGKNPAGPTSGNKRVLRGGGYNVSTCTSSVRDSDDPANKFQNVGFRVACRIP